jgi:hypothetical protein
MLAASMVKKAEASLEAAGNLGMSPLPRTPFGKWEQRRQIVACG